MARPENAVPCYSCQAEPWGRLWVGSAKHLSESALAELFRELKRDPSLRSG